MQGGHNATGPRKLRQPPALSPRTGQTPRCVTRAPGAQSRGLGCRHGVLLTTLVFVVGFPLLFPLAWGPHWLMDRKCELRAERPGWRGRGGRALGTQLTG